MFWYCPYQHVVDMLVRWSGKQEVLEANTFSRSGWTAVSARAKVCGQLRGNISRTKQHSATASCTLYIQHCTSARWAVSRNSSVRAPCIIFSKSDPLCPSSFPSTRATPGSAPTCFCHGQESELCVLDGELGRFLTGT